MLCERFSQSWFNGEHTVVRRRLKPFSLWHLTYLNFVDSPLAPGAEEGKAGWDDVELAARICQLGYSEQLPERPGLIGGAALAVRLFSVMARSTIQEELDAFEAYVSDYFSPPQFNEWHESKPGRPRGSPPDPLSVASACIMLGVGVGEEGGAERFVWEMPIGKAYWYASTLHYNRGAQLDYITARETAIRKFLQSQREKGLI